eukprot:6880357-Pyramimonas_sp.AAC.1
MGGSGTPQKGMRYPGGQRPPRSDQGPRRGATAQDYSSAFIASLARARSARAASRRSRAGAAGALDRAEGAD